MHIHFLMCFLQQFGKVHLGDDIIISIQRKNEDRKNRLVAQGPAVSSAEYCLQLNVLRLQTSYLLSPPCTCSEPQVKTQVFLAGPSQCVPCVWDAADPVKQWSRGPSGLEGLARCSTQVHALLVGFVPPAGAGQGQPFTPEAPKLAVVYFSNLHHWEISRSGHDWRTFSLL